MRGVIFIIHIRVHNHYSIKRAYGTPNQFIDEAKKLGMTHLGITNYGNDHSFINHWNGCKREGIQPIFGVEMFITNDMTSKGRPNFSEINKGNDTIIFLAKNYDGYSQILKIITDAHREEHMFIVPRIDYDYISDLDPENLICIIPYDFSTISKYLMSGEEIQARRLARMLKGLFGEDLYFELSSNVSDTNKIINKKMLNLANQLDIQCIASSNVHYPNVDDMDIFNILLADGQKKTYAENDLYNIGAEDHYLKSDEQVRLDLHRNDLKDDLIEILIENSHKVADKCTFELEFPSMNIPNPPIPKEFNSDEDYFNHLIEEGWNNKFIPRINSGDWDEVKKEDMPVYNTRKSYEYSMIKNIFTMRDPNHPMKEGFIPYFLIVQDYSTWAKGINRKRLHDAPIIEVGPARGSVSGSLLGYLTNMTTIDPIPFGLTFERFINPERVSWPDIDLDFDPDNAWWVEKYLIETYGADHVAHIITFQTAAGKKAFEMISKVLSGKYGKYGDKVKAEQLKSKEELAKLLPMTAKEAREIQNLIDSSRSIKDQLNPDSLDPDGNSLYNPQLHEYAKLTKYKKLFELMIKIEGTITSTGSHPGACVITREPLWKHCSVINNGGKYPDGSILYVTSYEKYNMEECNTMKFDILRLAELIIVRDALKYIKESTGIDVDLDRINPFDIGTNKKILKMLKDGDTNGIFQFSSKLYQSIIEEVLGNLDHLPEESIAADLFNIIIALEALGRPGPLEGGMVPTFAKGLAYPETIDKIHPDVDDVLKETYGNMLYQEQVMFILMRLGGFSLGQADMVRRGIAAGKREKIEEQRKPFLDGVKKVQLNKYPNTTEEEINALIELANHIFDLMAKWAGYGFNKAHSVGYGFLTYRGAYLKVEYKTQFMAALMSQNAGNEDKIVKYIDEIRSRGINVLTPKINKALKGFTVNGDEIIFGLEAIKGLGEKAVDNIISNYPYSSFIDFIIRTDSRSVGKRAVAPLIYAGFFNEDKRFLLKYSEALMEIIKNVKTKKEELLINFINERGITDVTQVEIEKRINDIILERSYKKRNEKTKQETLNLINKTEYTDTELLNLEKEVLGMYLSDSPLNKYQELIYNATVIQKDIKDYNMKTEIFIVGIITEIPPVRLDKNQNEMAFLKLQMIDGLQECVIFHGPYNKYKSLLTAGRIVIIKGKKGRGGGFQVESIADLEQKYDAFYKYFEGQGLLNG
jgi:DNA polymerase-3 subunit alpha